MQAVWHRTIGARWIRALVALGWRAPVAFAVVALGLLLAAHSAGRMAQPRPAGVPGHWRLVFDDEFRSGLDSSHWSPSRFPGDSGLSAGFTSSELECFGPQQAAVAGGELRLRLSSRQVSCGGVAQPYVSGVVSTEGKWSYTYGYLEARVLLPGHGAVLDWPAVWAVGADWPADGEIDVVEGLQGQPCWHFHGPAGAPGGCMSTRVAGGWHTYGADWEPGEVTWYLDGRRIGVLRSGVTSAPMSLVLDLAVSATEPASLRAPAVLAVRYVRVWQHPAAAARSR